MFKKLALPALALFALQAQPANATPVTHSFSATVDGATSFVLPGPFENTFAGSEIRLFTGVSSTASYPFSLADGDTVELDVSVTGPGLTITDAGFGLSEFIAFSSFKQDATFVISTDNPGEDTVISYDRTVTVTVDSFSGDLAGPLTITSALENIEPAFSMSAFLNFTDSSVTLFDFTITATYSNFVYGAGFESYAGDDIEDGLNVLLVGDDLLPVPAPGALALLGFGLLGLVTRCRTA